MRGAGSETPGRSEAEVSLRQVGCRTVEPCPGIVHTNGRRRLLRRRTHDLTERLERLLSTTASYLAVSSNLSRTQASIAADPTVKRATDQYLANIGKVKTIQDFVGNYQLFSYAMKAFGLGDLTYAKGLMTKVLEGGVTNQKALANTLSDPRYKAFAKAFDFAGQGAKVTSSAAVTTGTTAKYIEQALEDRQGKQNQGVQLALYFQRNAASVTTPYGLLADAAMLKVVQTIFGISPNSGQANVDTQAAYLGKVLNVADLQNPAKVQKLVQRFTAQWDASGNNANTAVPNALLVTDGSSAGLSSDLLMSIAGLKLGGG